MKKLGKTLLAATVMSLAVGLFAGISASAAAYSGSFTELYGSTTTWSVDTSSKTLTLAGSGTSHLADPNQEIPWLPYAEDIETVVADSRINLNGSMGLTDRKHLPNLETIVRLYDGNFRESYDLNTRTTTLTGKGQWPDYPTLLMYANSWMHGTLIIEDGITGFNGNLGNACERLVIGKDFQTLSLGNLSFAQDIEVKEENPFFSSYDGCLYSKNHEKLLLVPQGCTSIRLHPDTKIIGADSFANNNLTGTLVLPWGVTTVEKNVFNDFNNRVTVVIPDTVTNFDPAYNNSDKVIFMISKGNSLFDALVKTGTEIWTTSSIGKYYPDGIPEVPEEEQFAYYDGCKYTKDYQKLLSVPGDKKEVKLHPDVKIIGAGSFYTSTPPATIVIPWGVTTIEDDAFCFPYTNPCPNVILPDTITSMKQDHAGGKDCQVLFTYSRSNAAVHNVIGNVKDSYDYPIANPVDSVDQYYPDRPVDPAQSSKKGWALENGTWYYYKDGHRTSGWILDQGTWYYLDVTGAMRTGWMNYNGSTYYLRPWGGMMVNGWYQINGKWYYFQSWGGTAKNTWIYGLDKKWYYVGSDGVMLTNTQTPDGYWVDKNGVWVR